MSHGAKLHQNPRFSVGKCFHDLENVSVKRGAQVLIQSKILHTFSYDYVTKFLSDICYF